MDHEQHVLHAGACTEPDKKKRARSAACKLDVLMNMLHNEIPYAATIGVITYAMTRHTGELPRSLYTITLFITILSGCANVVFLFKRPLELLLALSIIGTIVVAAVCCDDQLFGEHVMITMYAIFVNVRSPTFCVRCVQVILMAVCAVLLGLLRLAKWYVVVFALMIVSLMRPRRNAEGVFLEEGTIPESIHEHLAVHLYDMSDGHLMPGDRAIATLRMANNGDWHIRQNTQMFVDMFVTDIVDRQDPFVFTNFSLQELADLCVGRSLVVVVCVHLGTPLSTKKRFVCSVTIVDERSAILSITENDLSSDKLPIGILFIGEQCDIKVIKHANRFCCHYLGYTNEDTLVGAPANVIGLIPMSGSSLFRVMRLRREDGSYKTALVCVEPYVIEPHICEIIIFVPG